ncbi:MAG: 50S ribosomal protein L34e [Candidatus Bathyarchaeia archaeon]
MPQPHLRTRSKKRLKVALPGGRNKTHYKKASASTPKCISCKKPLAGIPHLTAVAVHKLNRGKRRVWRPYSGVLCHNCLKSALKQAARTI